MDGTFTPGEPTIVALRPGHSRLPKPACGVVKRMGQGPFEDVYRVPTRYTSTCRLLSVCSSASLAPLQKQSDKQTSVEHPLSISQGLCVLISEPELWLTWGMTAWVERPRLVASQSEETQTRTLQREAGTGEHTTHTQLTASSIHPSEEESQQTYRARVCEGC